MFIAEIKEDLNEEIEELELLCKLWSIYEKTDNIYYNIPLPDEINRIYDNEIGYNKFTTPNHIEEYKQKLNYYKIVAEYYDNNDFVIDKSILSAYDPKEILNYFITPPIRRKAHGICEELEKSIKLLTLEKQ